jgi:hypothetical protein
VKELDQINTDVVILLNTKEKKEGTKNVSHYHYAAKYPKKRELYLIMAHKKCGMSVFTATTTYDSYQVGRNCDPEKGNRAFFFLSGRAAGCTLGGARCVAASWLAVGRNSGTEKGVLLLVQPSRSLAAEQYSSRERGSDWRVMTMLAISSGAGS